MELVKKNILSIICGVVALIAIVASFVPLGGYIEALQGDLNKSKSSFESLTSLKSKPRNLPTLSLDETTPRPLGMFPSQDVIDKAGNVVKEVEAQSIKMRDAAVAMNRRLPLVPRSLPSPGANDELSFRNRYLDLMSFGPNGEISPILKKYNAGVLPKTEEITRFIALKRQEIERDRVIRGVNGQIANPEEIAQALAEAATQIPAQMRQNVADRSMFYVDALTLDRMTEINPQQRPTPITIWWAQVALWVQQDVLAAITEANKGSESLTKAPVKRLTKVSVPFMNSFVTAAAAAAPVAGAAPPTGDPFALADAAITKVVQASPTGRVSNGMFDVVQFKVDLIMEVDKIPAFLRTLSHNRLMTAYQVDVKAVDAEQARLEGFHYGDKPVSQVTLSCEALLLRHWTIPLMPKFIKQQLGVPEPGPAAPAEATPGTAMAQ